MSVQVFGNIALDLAKVTFVSANPKNLVGGPSPHIMLQDPANYQDVCILEVSNENALAVLRALKKELKQ